MALMDFKVSLSADLTTLMVPAPVLISPHDQISSSTGVPSPGPAAIDLEPMANMYWPPGALTGAHKLTETVKHKNLCIVQEQHDLGPLLLHIQVAPLPDDCLAAILHTLMSSRSVIFSAGEVQANGAAIGCVTYMPPSPMMICANPVNLPAVFSPTNMLNSVVVGLSPWDYVAGLVAIAVDIVRSLAFDHFKGKIGVSDAVATDVPADKAFDASLPGTLISSGNATALVRAIGRATGTYDGPASFSAGMGPASAQLTLSNEGQQLTAQAAVPSTPISTGDQPIANRDTGGNVTWF